MPPAPPLDQLILSVNQGDVEALQALYEHCGSAVFAVAQRILSNAADSEEVVQDTFLQIWQQARHFDHRRASVKGWILMIARSRALDRARRVTVRLKQEERLDRVEYALATATADDDPCDRLVRGEQTQALQRELDALPSGQRLTLDLSFREGLSHTEISAALSQPLGTVKTRIREAMRRVRSGINGTPPAAPATEPSPFTSALAHFLASQPRHLESGAHLRGRRVLLVDDDPDTLDLVRAILRAAGVKVATARCCRQGLERLADDWPDIVVADIVMPATDGYAFVGQARALADASGRRLVAAAFTALGKEATPQARAAGFALLIAKPVQPEALLDTLDGLAASA